MTAARRSATDACTRLDRKPEINARKPILKRESSGGNFVKRERRPEVEFVKVKRWKGKEQKRQKVMSLPGDQSMGLFDQPSRAIEEACCCLADDSFKAVSCRLRGQSARLSNE